MDHDHNNTAKEINLFCTDVTHVLSLEQPPPPKKNHPKKPKITKYPGFWKMVLQWQYATV